MTMTELQPFATVDGLASPTLPADDVTNATRAEQGPVGAGEIVRIRSALVMYRRHMRPMLRPTTLTQQGWVVENFAQHTNNIALRACKKKHVEKWLAGMDVAASTIRHRISVMRTFWRWCVEQNLCKHDPTLTLRAPRQPRAIPRSLTLDELTRLGMVLPDHRARVIVALMLHMGLRAGEVAGLDMADLDLFSNTMRVVGKGGHERVLPVPEAVRVFLDPYLGERGRGGGRLVRSLKDPAKGISAHAVSALLTGWMREAGLKAGAYDGRSGHALRHTTAENMYRHGVDLRTIAAAMGHASPNTTWVYLRHAANVEDLRQVMGQQIIEEQRPSLRPVPVFEPPAVAGGGVSVAG